MKKTKKKLEPTLIGIFVVLSLILFMVGISLFGGAKFFEKESLVIAYFDDSLKGLSVGAPVTYRGVTIGQVKEIQIQIIENGQSEHNVIIPIIIALDGGQDLIIQKPDTQSKQDVDAFLESMCKQGLRAKLKTISLVTGKRYIDLAMYKDSIPVYRDKGGKLLEIPTLPSDMLQAQKIIENIDFAKLYTKILGTFESLDNLSKSLSKALPPEKTKALMDELLHITKNLNATLKQIDTGLGPVFSKVDGGLDNLNSTVNSANEFISALDTGVQPLLTGSSKTIQNFNSTLLQVNQLLSQAEKTLQPSSPLYHRINETLRQFAETSRAIRKLSDSISRNPDSLIFGLQQTEETHEQN